VPTTDNFNFPYEALTDQPGWSLHGGLLGTELILAEEVDRELNRVESDATSGIGDLRSDLNLLSDRFNTTGAQTIDYINDGAGTNTTEFVNIPQNFKDLLILWYGQSDGAGEIDSLALRFNGDGGNNYVSRLTRNTSTDTYSTSSGTFSVLRAGYVGTTRGVGAVWIPSYSLTLTKYAHGTGFARGLSGGNNTFTCSAGGHWTGTAAIESIRVWVSSQLWVGTPKIQLIGFP
jgi:hypothetical protein